jgi:hypothetical protein
MADNAWVSLLQKAPSYAEQQAGVASGLGAYGGLQQALAGAAGTNATTAGTEIANKQKMALNMAIKNSSSYDPSTGVRTFDPEKFGEAISQSEYGADALAKYPDILKIYQDNAIQSMSSATQNPNGSPNEVAQAEYVKSHPLAAASLTAQGYANRQQPIAAAKARAQSISEINAITGQNYQEAQPGSIAAQNSQTIADPVAEAKARAAQMESGGQSAPEGTQMTPGTGESTITGTVPPANPFSLTGTVDVKPMEAEAGTLPFHYDPKLLHGDVLKSAQASARANGVQLTSGTPDAAAAALDVVAHNKFEEARAAASKPVYKDGQLDALTTRANVAAFNKSAPAIQNQIYAALTTQGQGVRSTDLSQTGAGLSNTGAGQVQDQVSQYRSQGYNVNPGNIGKFLDVKGQYDWLGNTAQHIAELQAQIKDGKAIDTETFGNVVRSMENAPQVAESISNLAQQKKFLEGIREEPSYGALVKAADGNPVHFFQGLAGAKLGAQSQKVVLDQLGTIVNTQLKTGQAKSNLDQFQAKGSIAEKKKKAISDEPADPLGIRKP